jgi:hypothetical protein
MKLHEDLIATRSLELDLFKLQGSIHCGEQGGSNTHQDGPSMERVTFNPVATTASAQPPLCPTFRA